MNGAMVSNLVRAVITMRRLQRRCAMPDADDAVRAEARTAEHMVDRLANEIGKREADQEL